MLVPDGVKQLLEAVPTEHLTIHDAHGDDLVVEFLDGQTHFHDNKIGVLTNSPPYDWHLTNLRNYVGLSNVEAHPVNLMGLPVTPTGNGSGLLGMPGDVTPPSRFIRATMLTEVVDQGEGSSGCGQPGLPLPGHRQRARFVAASGDYTQWSVARDHDNCIYYARLRLLGHRRPRPVHVGVDGTGERSMLPRPGQPPLE